MKYKGLIGKWAFLGTAAIAVLAGGVPVSGQDVDVRILDGRVSVDAIAVPLSELLGTLDRVAGTESSFTEGLGSRNVSARFASLSLEDAIHKVFEGQGLDYVVVGQRRIMVTAVSGETPVGGGTVATSSGGATAAGAAVANPNPFQSTPSQGMSANPFANAGQASDAVGGNPFVQSNAGQPAVQPPVVQTPFGPMVNPRAGQSQQPANPLSPPGQSPFGGGNRATTTQPSVFGNTSPPILDLNKQQSGQQPSMPGVTPGTGGPPFPTPGQTSPFPEAPIPPTTPQQ